MINSIQKRALFVIAYFLLPTLSFATTVSGEPCDTSGKICNPIPSITNLPDFIRVLLEGILKLGMPLLALAIIYCGFLFVSARGNSEKISQAKSALLWTLVGAAILLGSWALAKLIAETVNAL